MFVGAHEVFHIPRHSRQIAGRNGENEADQFALEQLHDFRRAVEHTSRMSTRSSRTGQAGGIHSPCRSCSTDPSVNGRGTPTYSCSAEKANGG